MDSVYYCLSGKGREPLSWKIIKNYRKLILSETELSPAPKGGRVSFLLASPKPYYLGMSNLGIQIIYRTLKANQVYCERSFLPEIEEEQELRRQKKPLFSLETQRPIQEFDIIGFSISYEFEFLGILKTLEMGHIPLYSHEREWPLIVAGGAITVVNPEPIAPFIDLFIIGEGEEAIIELVECYEKYASFGKKTLLEELAKRDGFYVPAFYNDIYNNKGDFEVLSPTKPFLPLNIKRRFIKQLDLHDGHSEILTPFTEFSNMFLMEIARGCAYNCNFCMVGSSYGPYRIRHIESVLRQIQHGLNYTNKIGLMGATVGNYKYIRELCKELTDRNVTLSVSSLRADTMPPELINALAEGKQNVVTIAPETGRESLRFAINKKIKNKEIYETAELISLAGISKIKLYFMIGIPGETKEDIDAAIDMICQLRTIQKKITKKTTKTIVSINSFVPKPFTAFERETMAHKFYLDKALTQIGNALKNDKNIEYSYEEPSRSILQGLLAKGDRRLASVLFDLSKLTNPGIAKWDKQLAKHSLSLEQFVWRKSSSQLLPWHHLSIQHNKTCISYAAHKQPLATVKGDIN